MTSDIVVIGSLNLDIVARVDRFPGAGETVHSNSIERYPGGKGANQAVAAARLGSRVRMIGRVGRDDAGDVLKHALAANGVDISGVLPSDVSTGTALITTDANGENSIVVADGANGQLSPEDIDHARDQIAGAAMVLTQLEVPFATVSRIAELCREHGVPLMLDPAPGRALPSTLLRKVTWLTPNESETVLLLGNGDGAAMSRETQAGKLLDLGAKNVLLKLGASGLFLSGRTVDPQHFRAFPVVAVDTTAAGDVLNGAFACGLVRGWSLAKSARYAAAAAALSVTRHGAQPSMPAADEVDALMETVQRS